MLLYRLSKNRKSDYKNVI